MTRATALFTVILASASCRTMYPPPLPALDGKQCDTLAVQDIANVIVFSTVDCPIANSYAPEIRALAADYGKAGIAFYLVHVDPDLTVDEMRAHAKEYGYTGVTIVQDVEHALVRFCGADRTPEAVVITASRKIVYQGAIDDWYADIGKKRPQARKRYLRNALDDILAGRPVSTPRTEAVGCFMPVLERK